MLTADAPPPPPHQARNKDGDAAFVHVARLPPGNRLQDPPYTSLYLPASPDISLHLPISRPDPNQVVQQGVAGDTFYAVLSGIFWLGVG